MEEIILTKNSGAHTLKKFNTISTPLMVKIKQTVAAITKAITWFLVIAEIQDPMDS